MGSQNNYLYRQFLLGSIPREQSDNNSIISVKYNPGRPNMTLMPSKFQSSDGGASFSQGRSIFLNTENIFIPTNNYALKQAFKDDKNKKCKCQSNCENSVCQCSECNIRNKKYSCSVGKFLPVQSGDQHIQRLKNRAIGRGTLAKQYGDNHVASFSGSNDKKSINYQNTQQALRRLRNRGYVVPPKVVANRNAAGTCLGKNCNIIFSKYDYTTHEWSVYNNKTGTENIIDNKIIYNILYSGCEINMEEASGNFPSNDYITTYMNKDGIIQIESDRTQLIQLVAFGVQDVNLAGNPRINYWTVTYRQHTNFHIDSLQ